MAVNADWAAQTLTARAFSNFSWAAVVSCLAITLGAYVVYQTIFHPLARYPGPLLGKLTRLYSVHHALKGNQHTDLFSLHNRYGPIVRFGPDHISINKASALNGVYGHDMNVRKSSWYAGFFGINIFNAVDHQVHARKKRIMAQAFSDQAVREMEPHILSAIRDWCYGIGDALDTQRTPGKSEWSSVKDMVQWGAYVIFDALGELCFGRTFETSTKPDNHVFFDLTTLNARVRNICGQMPVLYKISFAQYLRRGTAASRAKQVDYMRKQFGTRMAPSMDNSARRDIIHFLQLARDPDTGESFPEQELIGEAVGLLWAGSDTTNTALTANFYFLAHHKEVLDRLTSDIRKAFTDVESIRSGDSMQQMTYLHACLDESMRLCPPIPTLLPREVQSGGLEIDGHYFPSGTIVGVPTYALHHSKEHFYEPFAYRPERWLLQDSPSARKGEGVTADLLAHQREAFVPFSTGPRACIGHSVALVQLELSIARALWLYDVRLAPGTEQMGNGPHGEYKIKDNFIVGKEGPILQFRRRI